MTAAECAKAVAEESLAMGEQAKEFYMPEIERLRAEVARLQRGDFTPAEFQNLCHHLDEKPGCTRALFEGGCLAYQDKLFGPRTTQS